MLLGALQTRLIVLQSAFYKAFKNLDPLQVLETFSTPKLRSMLDILRRFDLTSPIECYKPRRPVIIDDEDEDKNDAEQDSGIANCKTPAPTKTCRERRRKNVRWETSRKGRKGQNKNKRKTSDSDPVAEDGGEPTTTVVDTEEVPNAEIDHSVVQDVEVEQIVAESAVLPAESKENGIASEIAQDDDSVAIQEIPDDADKVDIEQIKQRKGKRFPRKGKQSRLLDPPLCGIVFVDNRFDARIL